jgi:hypothetical protein
MLSLDANLNNLVVLTVSIQFALFGWRIVREIAVGDKMADQIGKDSQSTQVWRGWLPWPDRVNLVSLGLVTVTCVALPIVTGRFSAFGRAVLVGAVILWMFHPISTACHYELFRGGRQVVYGGPDEWPAVTRSERMVVVISVLLALASTFAAWSWIVGHAR